MVLLRSLVLRSCACLPSQAVKQLAKRRARAEEQLAKAQGRLLEIEGLFLRAASEALGPEAWEARAALSALAKTPLSWSPSDVPLPRDETALEKRAFVLDFAGDTAPAQVETLREEVNAVVCALLPPSMSASHTFHARFSHLPCPSRR